jgi:cation:H+ antiporter
LSSETPSRQNLTWLGIFILVGVPGIALHLSGTHLDPVVAAIVFGIGIGGGAFLLSWAAEVAQVDILASLAIAVLALIAILPNTPPRQFSPGRLARPSILRSAWSPRKWNS